MKYNTFQKTQINFAHEPKQTQNFMSPKSDGLSRKIMAAKQNRNRLHNKSIDKAGALPQLYDKLSLAINNDGLSR
jgi:hypothetical protein